MTVKYDPDVIGNVRPVNACEWDLLFFGVESFSEPGVAAFRAQAGATSNELLAANGGLAAYLEFCVLPTAPPGDHVLGYADRPEGLRDVMNMCAMTDGYTWTYTPVLRNGKLTVAGDAVPGDCPHDPPPLTRIFPETKIALGTAEAAPGSTEVRVPITITSNGPMISRWDIGVLYDPETIGNVTVENTCDWSMEVCGVDIFWDPGVLGVIAGSTWATEEKWRASGGIAAYLKFCVLPTAAPGEYPLIFVDDPPGKHYIHIFCTTEIGGGDLTLQTGKLTVAGDPVSVDACPRDPPPPMRPAGSFRLEGGTAHAGEEIVVPFIARGNYPLCAFTISIDFDEEVLEAVGVEKAFAMPDGQDWDYARFIIDNSNATPGSNGVDEGYIVGGADFASDPEGNEANLPPKDTDVTLLNLRFRVRPEAPSGETTLAFIDGTRTPDGGYWENMLGAGWWSMKPEQQISPIRIDALFRIVGDISIFVRGDANGDDKLDISDAVTVLGYLFIGRGAPDCSDAADANDDGFIDISDPIAILMSLFLSSGPLPPPSGKRGVDPTPDNLPEC